MRRDQNTHKVNHTPAFCGQALNMTHSSRTDPVGGYRQSSSGCRSAQEKVLECC